MTRRRILAAVLGLALATVVLEAQSAPPTARELVQQLRALLAQLEGTLPPDQVPCTFAVAPTTPPTVGVAGGVVPFTITTANACAWSIVAPDAWAQPRASSGTGGGVVPVDVQANPGQTTRTTAIVIAGIPIAITQGVAAVTVVTTAAELTAALATGGDIALQPGRYVGNFVIAKPATIVGVTGIVGRVPDGGAAAVTLEAQNAGDSPVKITASNVTLRGVTINSINKDRSALLIGDPAEPDPMKQPDNVLIDQNEITAGSGGGWRGIDAHTRTLTVTRNRIENFWYLGRDSQAFYACNGPGPYLVADNFLEASGENVLFGGGSIRTAAQHPANVIVRGNLITKPQAWVAQADVKNLVECKACDGALIEGNTLDGSWRDAQDGHAILLTPRNPYNDSPWTVVRNIRITGNTVSTIPDGYMVQILYTDNNAPSQPTSNVTIDHNLFTGRALVQSNGGLDGTLRITDNTFPLLTHAVLTFNNTSTMGKPICEIFRNVGRHGYYGINSQNAGQGSTALAAYCASYTVGGNVIEESNGTTYRWGRWPSGTGKLLPLGGLAPLIDPVTYKYLAGGAGY